MDFSVVTYGPWPNTCPLDKLWTNIGFELTLDKVWVPVVAAHGQPTAHGPLYAHYTNSRHNLWQRLDSITCLSQPWPISRPWPTQQTNMAHLRPIHDPLKANTWPIQGSNMAHYMPTGQTPDKYLTWTRPAVGMDSACCGHGLRLLWAGNGPWAGHVTQLMESKLCPQFVKV